MSWQEGVAIAVVLLGLGAGAFLVAQRPSFWIEFGARLGKALLPLAWRYVSRRMPPEEAVIPTLPVAFWLRLPRFLLSSC